MVRFSNAFRKIGTFYRTDYLDSVFLERRIKKQPALAGCFFVDILIVFYFYKTAFILEIASFNSSSEAA